jgi:protein N-terminal asparagine amidohydrolase
MSCNVVYYYVLTIFQFLYTGSGATCMAHVDGADQESGITPLLARIQEVSQGYANGRIELHLVGGYMDPRGYSERLVITLLRKNVAPLV